VEEKAISATVATYTGSHSPNPHWLLVPGYDDWSKQHRKAVTWLLGHTVLHKFQSSRKLMLIDYMDFLRRARWKT
jgi:hypothetical protein